MLFAKQAWEKTASYVLLNEILMMKYENLMEKYPNHYSHPVASAILDNIERDYHENSELLAFVTDKLQEKDHSIADSLTEDKKRAKKIGDILNLIYSDVAAN